MGLKVHIWKCTSGTKLLNLVGNLVNFVANRDYGLVPCKVVIKDRHGNKDFLYRCDRTNLSNVFFEYSLQI
jgi:hypothetical protein